MFDLSRSSNPVSIECALNRGVILLHLGEGVFSLERDGLRIEGIELRPKRELHITIVSGDVGRLLAERIEESPAAGAAFCKSVYGWDWRYCRTGLMFLVRRAKDGRNVSSVIELVSMPGIAPFYREVSRLVRRPLLPPPAHVTLFTCGDDRGIGLRSRKDLETFGRQLRPDELFGDAETRHN